MSKKSIPKRRTAPRSHSQRAAAVLVEIARDAYQRGWVLGTSGNFSAVLCWEPLSLAITASGMDKGRLTTRQILQINGRGKMLCGEGRPSAETALHLAVVRARRAGAVLHTHSVWSTILSEAFAAEGRLGIQGYEMLKGLEGVGTHEQREWVPIVENSQDIRKLAHKVSQALEKWPHAHGILLRRHGLYTWGTDLFQARRHLEVLEFLLEVVGRKYCAPKSGRISRPAV